MFKKILIAILILALIGGGAAYYMWTKPHEKVEDTKGINISAAQLAKEYQADETAANAKYLNKAIEVSGKVDGTDKNADGSIMAVNIETGDPIMVVHCNMRDKGITANKGQSMVIKGFCSGSTIADINLTDCVIK